VPNVAGRQRDGDPVALVLASLRCCQADWNAEREIIGAKIGLLEAVEASPIIVPAAVLL
jgi:hypothetical protein